MGNSATKLPLNYQPNPMLPLLQVLEYFKRNLGIRKDLKQIREAVNELFGEDHTEKIIRVALGHLVESNYIGYSTEEKNKRVYYVISGAHWDAASVDEYEIFALHILQAIGLSICDYGNTTANITNQMLQLKSRDQNNFSKMVADHANVSVPFFQVPDNKGRSIVVQAIKNYGRSVTVRTVYGLEFEGRVGGISLRRGNIYMVFVVDGRVVGHYVNEIDSLTSHENGLRLEFTTAVKMAIFGLTNSAFDGEVLVEMVDFRLEIHPSAVQAIIYGRPQSDYCQFDGLTQDGWLVFDMSDDIRQELVDLLAGMAGRVHVIEPVELRDLVAERIQEIASTVG